jgi:DNA-binding LytR/AlgR family response regulator
MQFVLDDNTKILSRLTMTETEGMLPASSFVRIHRSYIVAKKYISKIDRNFVWINGEEIPVGASYADEVARIMG